MSKDGINKGIKKIAKVLKDAKKALKICKNIKKGTAAGISSMEKVSTEKSSKIITNIEGYQGNIDEKTQKFEDFLEQLQSKFDKAIGDNINQQAVLIENWIAEHGGKVVEKFLTKNSSPDTLIIPLHLKRTIKNILRKVSSKIK